MAEQGTMKSKKSTTQAMYSSTIDYRIEMKLNNNTTETET